MYVCMYIYMCILILAPVKIHYLSVVTIIMVIAFGGGPIALQIFRAHLTKVLLQYYSGLQPF